MKKCTACGCEKSCEHFPVKKASRDGRASQCKDCKSAVDRLYRLENRDKAIAYAARYYEENKLRLLENNAKYRAAKKVEINVRRAEYRKLNKEKKAVADAIYAKKNADRIKAYKNDWYVRNRARIRAAALEYRAANAEAIKACKAKYRSENFEKIRASGAACRARNQGRHTDYTRARYNKDPIFALTMNVRNRINSALSRQGYSKSSKTVEMLGCNYLELVAHLESRFSDGMSWENRGEWHIDHIIPLASAKTEEEIIALCHYTNLQPLWAFENLSKGARMPDIHMMGSGNVRTDI